MGLNRRAGAVATGLCATALGLAAASAARAEETQASRAARWHDVAAALFHGVQFEV